MSIGLTGLAHFPLLTSANIIDFFDEFFHRCGVAEQISLGGPNLSSYEIRNWLLSG